MRKIKIELTAVFLINVLIAAYIPPAYAGKEAAAALSPAININSPFIQNSLSVIAQDPQKLDDCGLGLEELSLAERSRLIVARCENGDYRLLSVDFEKRKFDYQQHIKEVAAINDALNRIIGEKSGLRGFKDKSGFLKAAIATRLSIIENYSVHLSEYGNVMFNQIKSGIAMSGDDELLVALERLCDPSREWFSGMLSDKAAAAIFETSPDIILTWGCSTQCDHCNGASIIRITSFPWPWIEELSRQFEDLSVMLFRNDFFRDYYDPVFHKDAYDVMEKFYITELNTSGFAPGSVAENALKRSKDRFGIVKISIAPSAWMRKIGTENYIRYLLNVINLAEGARKILGFKV
ncbi:MAG: hypothetical protein PHO30_08375, partial [Candidatus Omnitrophica bacterium]|nr:hypothetical protein [Candidatus Omnitrophota bacterium]